MLTVTPETEAVLARAAELRAEGSSWAATARALGYEEDDLKGICRDAGKAYDRLYARACRAVVRQALAEAVSALRKLLRSDDRRVALRAGRGGGRAGAPGRRRRVSC